MRRLSADLVWISTWSADVPSGLEARDTAEFGRLVVSVTFALNSPFDQPGKYFMANMYDDDFPIKQKYKSTSLDA